jgi:glycosyltransferase involved in cell wall biosynthesis
VRSLRVALIKPEWQIRGGFEFVTDRLVEHLKDRGHRVDVLAPDAWRYTGTAFGVEVADSVFEEAPQFFRYVTQLEQCAQIDAHRADLALSTLPPSFAVDHRRHLSVFYHHNRVFYDLADVSAAAGLVPTEHHESATAAAREIDQPKLAAVGHFLAGSEAVAERLADFNGLAENVSVFHAGPGVEVGGRTRPAHGKRQPLALCVSRHDFPKRTELFVHAAHLAPVVRAVSVGAGGRLGFARELDARLAREGTTPELDPTETWLNTPRWIDPATVPDSACRVDFASGLSDADLDALYASASCVVAPALQEDYGLTVIEAMQRGLPVITCKDSGHLTHLVDDGHTGFIVEPTGPAIADAIRRLTDDPALARELGTNARDSARAFTWERAFAEFDAAVEMVMS